MTIECDLLSWPSSSQLLLSSICCLSLIIKVSFSETISYKWLILFSYQLIFFAEAYNFCADSAYLSLISSSSPFNASFYPNSLIKLTLFIYYLLLVLSLLDLQVFHEGSLYFGVFLHHAEGLLDLLLLPLHLFQLSFVFFLCLCQLIFEGVVLCLPSANFALFLVENYIQCLNILVESGDGIFFFINFHIVFSNFIGLFR